MLVIEDAYGVSSPHPLAACEHEHMQRPVEFMAKIIAAIFQTMLTCSIVLKLAALISGVNSTCEAEADAEPAAGVQAAAAAGRVHVALQSLHVLLLSRRPATISSVNSTCRAEA